MSEQNKNISLSKNACIDYNTMKAYLQGQLNEAEMHKVELHLQSCTFCSDAFDGLNEQGNLNNHFKSIDKLKKEIVDRSTKIKVLKPRSKRPFVYAAIAALAIILFGLNFMFNNFNTKSKNKLAENNKSITEKEVKPVVEKKNQSLKADSVIIDSSFVNEEKTNEVIKPETESGKNTTQIAENNTNIIENTEIKLDSVPTSKNTELASAETEITEFKVEQAEVTGDIEVYKPNEIETTRTLGKTNAAKENKSKSLASSENSLKLIDEKVAQKKYSDALNIIYQLEHSADAKKLKLILTLKRAQIFALQFNKTMALNYLKSIKDKEINSAKEYKALLDSLSL